MSARRVFLFVVLPLFFLAGLGGMIFLVVYFLSPRDDLVTPNQLVSIPLLAEPSLLAWSEDGNYIAAGTGYTYGLALKGPAKVYLIDVAKQAVLATVETAVGVNSLAFSPDGKWLAVATGGGGLPDPNELLVLTVPEFTLKTRSESRVLVRDLQKDRLPNSFVDIAWIPDSKTILAVEGGVAGPPQFRRWTAPDFVEQPAIAGLTSAPRDALAVSPDRHTLAFIQSRPMGTGFLHLFDLETGKTISSIEDVPAGFYRAVFTADGKSVGVFSGIESMPFIADMLDDKAKKSGKRRTMSWWDVATGEPTNPVNPRFAVQPAAQAESRYYSIAPDNRVWAHSLMFKQYGKDGVDEDGRYVALTQTDTTKTWKWRFGNSPSLAFSPDSARLAGTLKTESGWTVAIWSVP